MNPVSEYTGISVNIKIQEYPKAEKPEPSGWEVNGPGFWVSATNRLEKIRPKIHVQIQMLHQLYQSTKGHNFYSRILLSIILGR